MGVLRSSNMMRLLLITLVALSAFALPAEKSSSFGEDIVPESSLLSTKQAAGLSVSRGRCTTDAAGCVSSPNYPRNYGNNQRCTINVRAAGTLSATHFNTESCCDKLRVNGRNYAGRNGPSNVAVRAGSQISWRSDFSVTRGGWKVCPNAPRASGSASARPSSSSGLSVSRGRCTTDAAGCVSSPNYPRNYGNNQRCTIN